MSLVFEWSEVKARANLAKHRISFEEARTAFLDEGARVIRDPDHSADEERLVLLGMTSRAKLVVVCHCYRHADSVVRIISARVATPQERRDYARWLP